MAETCGPRDLARNRWLRLLLGWGPGWAWAAGILLGMDVDLELRKSGS